MPRLGKSRWVLLLFLLCLFIRTAAVASFAQTVTTLVTFYGPNGGYPYYMTPVQGRDGSLYGTTYRGGAQDLGTVFKVTTDGKLTTLYSFCAQAGCADGKFPNSGLVLATDGNFYGTTWSGGDNDFGTIFRITSNGKLTTMHKFTGSDGATPYAGLFQGNDLSLYGTTAGGGANNSGTVFRISPAGTLITTYAFCRRANCHDGSVPYGGVVQATDGYFYGTTGLGGRNDSGTVFRITPSGKLSTLYSFCSQDGCADGGIPTAALVQGTDGSIYGTTVQGGDPNCIPPYGCGTIFKVGRAGGFATMHVFQGMDGLTPYAGLVQGTDGNFYGTTIAGGDLTCSPPRGCGTAFAISPEGALKTLHIFELTDGSSPYGGLVQATNGTYYGTTWSGGDDDPAFGTVYSLDMELEPFVAFVRSYGRVGQTGGILGQGFTGTTSVYLNGVSAAFTVASDTYIKATVPPGATSGYVTVSTPSGVLTSNVPFHVIP